MAVTRIPSSSAKPRFLVGQFASCGPYLVKSGLLSIPSDVFFPTKDLETNPLNSTKFLCIYIYIHTVFIYIYIYIMIYIYIYMYYWWMPWNMHFFSKALKALKAPSCRAQVPSCAPPSMRPDKGLKPTRTGQQWPDDLMTWWSHRRFSGDTMGTYSPLGEVGEGQMSHWDWWDMHIYIYIGKL